MHGAMLKGSDAEANYKSEDISIQLDILEDNIQHPSHMVCDFETDTSKNIKEDGSVLLHQVMHPEADIINVSDNHIYIYMKIH